MICLKLVSASPTPDPGRENNEIPVSYVLQLKKKKNFTYVLTPKGKCEGR